MASSVEESSSLIFREMQIKTTEIQLYPGKNGYYKKDEDKCW
jgi:hypothetical protein